jgi:hypothetical protein
MRRFDRRGKKIMLCLGSFGVRVVGIGFHDDVHGSMPFFIHIDFVSWRNSINVNRTVSVGCQYRKKYMKP